MFDYWFPERRFGMFVHFGLYAITGWQEQYQLRRKVKKSEYIKFKDEFNPSNFNPDEWIDIAEGAGMKYICFTAKHHDGFCMFDSQYTDYNIKNTPYGKDFLKILAEACERRDMGLSVYYSIPDCHHPNAYNEKSSHQLIPDPSDGSDPDMEKYIEFIKNQMTELCTKYGKLLSLFWDIPPQICDPSLNELVRSLQPGIMINNRGFDEGDYATPERERGSSDGRFSAPTEACQSIDHQSWGYREKAHFYSYKYITDSIDVIMSKGGNYLLNVGPKADGSIAPEYSGYIQKIGDWYKRVRESYEYAEPAPEIGIKNAMATKKGNALYIHLNSPMQMTGYELHPINTAPKSAVLLNNNQKVDFSVELIPSAYDKKDCLQIYNLPANEYADETMVVKLDFANIVENAADWR
ncbi:MAG: alpha-L-fucosidase [Oscillospiraceae bacterium]|nr:alpha-L-fucosidase [Oscillospiraceae bacterium]